MTWKLAEAKNRLSHVADLALTKGPQHITRRGDQLVLLSRADYDRMANTSSTPKKNFLQHLMSGPKLTDEDLVHFERQKDFPRQVDFGSDTDEAKP